MADEYDDDLDDELDDELDDDLDDDDDIDDDDDDDNIDIDIDDDGVTREDAIAYGHHLEAENEKERKRAERAEAENRILKRAMEKGETPAKSRLEKEHDRDWEKTGRDDPFRI